MHYKRVIPCLDVDAGRVVKGVGLRRSARRRRSRRAGVPLRRRRRRRARVPRHHGDLGQARAPPSSWLAATADDVFVPFTIGGGIRSVDDAQAVLDAGADKVSVNSAALARPELLDELASTFGAQCVVLAIDAKARDSNGWEAYVAGGRTPTGRDAVAWAREGSERGAGEILLTSMDRDGTNAGYDLALTAAVAASRQRARDRLRRRRRARRTCQTRSARVRTRCCAPRSSTTAITPSRRSRSTSPEPAWPFAPWPRRPARTPDARRRCRRRRSATVTASRWVCPA